MTEPDMPQDDSGRSALFRSMADAWDDDAVFNGLRKPGYDEEGASVGGLRRRRKSASNSTDEPIKTVSLIEENGVLIWRDDIPEGQPLDLGIGPRRRRMLRRAGLSAPGPTLTPSVIAKDPVVLTRTFPVLAPNKIMEAVGKIDQHLNSALNVTLRAQLRPLRKAADGTFTLGHDAAGALAGSLDGRTLLFVHGTFSNASNMLEEFKATNEGRGFLNAATGQYKNVVFFEHATLAVSPIVNALELGRLFADAGGEIDVIAHSRGGLVVRWWLEAFGKSLSILPAAPVRAVLVGSPLNGTSLAAPDKLQGALSLLSNIGSFVQGTLNLVGAANPFMWVAGKLVQVVVSATGALARTPLIDGVVSLIPGLSGQSMVGNNFEINRLRLGPCAVDPRYYAVQSNFETTDPGWKFWQYFRMRSIADTATNWIFRDQNDLVVDTASMTDFGVPNLQLADQPCDFGTTDKIWHCNYFRQPQTIAYITQKFS